jgi:hypothetical protein
MSPGDRCVSAKYGAYGSRNEGLQSRAQRGGGEALLPLPGSQLCDA